MAEISHVISRDVTFGAATHPGNVRELNEDAHLLNPPVFVVADGMGGHRAGNVASRIAVESLCELADSTDFSLGAVDAVIERCHQRIVALDDGTGRAPGSTLVAAIHTEIEGRRYWLIVNIGDSRAYLWSNGRLEQLTHDHTVAQELADSGALDEHELSTHPERHVITRALGAEDQAESAYSLVPVIDGSALLLCSDGVTNEVDDRKLEDLLRAGGSATTLARTIVDSAVWRGGRDNATALVIQVERSEIVADTISYAEPSDDTSPGSRYRR